MTIAWSDSGANARPDLSLEDAYSLAIQAGFIFATASSDAPPQKRANLGGEFHSLSILSLSAILLFLLLQYLFIIFPLFSGFFRLALYSVASPK